MSGSMLVVRWRTRLPFVLHDLAEAVQHTAVGILTSRLASLKLSILC